MTQVDMHEAKTRLSQLLELVERGERVVITRDGIPIADLAPHEPKPARRVGGQWEGNACISPNFDDPLPELEELFTAETPNDYVGGRLPESF